MSFDSHAAPDLNPTFRGFDEPLLPLEALGINALVGATTTATGSISADAAVLPIGADQYHFMVGTNSTAGIYPVAGGNGTKGVRIHASDKVTGRQLLVASTVPGKVKVYAPTGGTINGAVLDTSVSVNCGLFVCLDGATNTWAAVYK